MIAHEVLVRRFKILHKDISIYNLMFIQSRNPIRRGLLIDFDYAGDLDNIRRDLNKKKVMNHLAKTRLTEGYDSQAVLEVPAESSKPIDKGKGKPTQSADAEIVKKARDGKILKQNIIKYERLLACRGQRTVRSYPVSLITEV